eukprot:Blabericola_migrator_1__5324@NODE_272_length_10504_cov_138_380473_g227_i0_p1_GENE_NODE_272_length_10504_cov_138_380473_g227_i0NODE_272_length_10504_cov_138_380473_g227_i0_p1_ORF_typecomplete_len1787_score403_99PhoLip_ATPase_C/PF16212_5/1_7e04PhoLip_ATPase_C/PF16212_5/8e03PhoLip_ATPase_C/PF16212_5/2_1e37Hydrolase/PF00702_26/0_003Hydrolase/PF00702_26/7_3e20Hydrolase/PF00702_26/0_039E1E2_ATPase/PF00122_20/2_6e25E1E2_ATPase/PF00122_20/5_5e03PhoLip_ATPase_N/PF16209_5/3_9e15PhoLip_ATPase_N/PF16209_5/1
MLGWYRKLVRKLKRQEEDDRPDIGGTLTVRSVTHLPQDSTAQHVKQVRTPPTQGNQAWNVMKWSNSIKTSQYTWWNFLLLNLFQQAIIPANAYFILMVILQLIPAISDSTSFPTYLPPLAFVMAVTMIKDLWEDVQRHKSDRDENTRRTQILQHNGEWREAEWRDISPGDIVRVEADEVFPADMLMICCSDEFGIAYVETVQLDGETNMKTKTATPELNDLYAHNMRALAEAKLQVTYGVPSAKLYNFNGVLESLKPDYDIAAANKLIKTMSKSRSSIFGTLTPVIPPERGNSYQKSKLSMRTSSVMSPPAIDQDKKSTYVMGMAQFMWRGATLINTTWIAGIVVYTGHETRIFKNTRSRATKYSGLMTSYNYNAVSLLAMQLILCIVAGICYVADVIKTQDKAWYLQPESEREFQPGVGRAYAFAVTFGRYILLLSYFIPITLLVQIEIARWFHGFFIAADNQALSEVTGARPNVSTLSILEDLGNVTHVFSDKTGTLTQNLMQLKAFEINGSVFGFEELPTDDDDEIPPSVASSDNMPPPRVPSKTAPNPSNRQGPPLGLLPTDPQTIQEVEAEEDRWLRVLQEAADTRRKGSNSSGRSNDTIISSELRRSPNRFVDFDAADVRKQLLTKAPKPTRNAARNFLLILSVCHSVLPKTTVHVERVCDPVSVTVPADRDEDMQQTFYIAEADESSESSESTPKVQKETTTAATQSPQGLRLPSLASSDMPADPVNETPNAFPSVAASPTDSPFRTYGGASSGSSEAVKEPYSPSNAVNTNTPYVGDDHLEPPRMPNIMATKEPSARHSRTPPTEHSPQGPRAGFSRLVTAQLPNYNPKTGRFEFDEPQSAKRSAKRRGEATATTTRTRHTDSMSDTFDTYKPGGMKFMNTGWHTALRPSSLPTVPENRNLVPGVCRAAVRWNRALAAQFDASSPDELALVAGAKHLGVEFLRRPDLNTIEVGVLNENAERLYMEEVDRAWIRQKRLELGVSASEIIPTYTYDILECLDFDNIRKRMSVVMRDRDGTIKLLTKGADSSMLSVAAPGQGTRLKDIEDALADFAREGLRTLVLGYRLLKEPEFVSWQKSLEALRAAGVDDVEKYCEVFSELEKDLILVGCTAIEDKLQDQVPQTIEALKDAGIKVWVLTGDKVETAISIGYSANLLTDTTYNAIIDGSSVDEVREQMYKYMAFVVGGQLAKEAFDQILLQREIATPMTGVEETNAEDDDEDDGIARPGRGCCTRVCCVRRDVSSPQKKKRRQGAEKKTVAMDLDDFVNILTFNAKHKKVVAPVDGKSKLKALNPEELEQLIAVYLERFEPQDDKKKGWDFKLRGNKTARETKPLSPRTAVNVNVEAPSPESVEHYTSVALTVTGDALNHALSTDETRKYFYGLAHLCSTVIACRVTPKQKAEVVKQCGRCSPGKCFTSLGIGDGANDVGMILTAHVGVGIFGKEGSQAARSADIAIGEFKILRNLLFYHGHQILRRHSVMLYQTIFKNIMFASACYFCGIFSGFSAADPYNSYLKQFYNLLFTPWCIMAPAVFDRPLPYDVLFKCSSLYPIAMKPDGTQYFGIRQFLSWFSFGLVCGVIVTFFPYGIIATGGVESNNGLAVFDWQSYGQSVFVLVVLIGCAVSIPFTHSIFWFTLAAFVLSWGSLYLCWIFVSFPQLLGGSDLEGSFMILHVSSIYHFTMLLTAATPLLGLFAWWKYKVTFHPTPHVIIRERIKKGVFDVVVAPRQRGDLAVVVPKAQQRESWKGFAFSPSETRYSLRRKTLSQQRMNSLVEEPISYSAG